MVCVEAVIENELPATYWTGMLPQLMDTMALSPAKPLRACGSPEISTSRPGPPRSAPRIPLATAENTVQELLLNRGDKAITCSHASTCRSKA